MKWRPGMLAALMVVGALLGGCAKKAPTQNDAQGAPAGKAYIEQAFDGNTMPGLIGTAVNAQGELVVASQPDGKPLAVTTFDQQGRKKNSVDTDVTDTVSRMALGADGSVYALANPKDGVMTVHVLDAQGKTSRTIALNDLPSTPMTGPGSKASIVDGGPVANAGGPDTNAGGPAAGDKGGPVVKGDGSFMGGTALSLVTDMEATPDGGVVLCAMDKGIVQYDKDGNAVRTLGSAMIGILATDGKGTLWVFEQGRDGTALKSCDLASGAERSSAQPQNGTPTALFYDPQGQRLLAMTDRDIHPLGADGKAGAALTILGDTTLGDGTRTLLGFAIDGGGTLYISAAAGGDKNGVSIGGPAGSISFSMNNTGDQLVRLTLGDASSVKAKKVITVAALTESQAIKSLIAAFQQAYPDYRIDLKTYSSQVSGLKREDSQPDDNDAIQQFNTDLMSGKGADILVLDKLSYQKYLDKGLLTDLTPLMQQGGLDMSLYYTNILDACRVNGKLYALPGSFSFSLLAGRSADLPAGDPITMADFLAKAGSLGQGRVPFAAQDAMSLFLRYASHTYDDLVDTAAHKANFATPAFEQLLQQFKALTDANPAPQSGEKTPEFADLLDGKGAYGVVDLRSPMDLGMMRTVFSDDLALRAMPTLQGGDARDFEPSLLMGINSAAADQKMAFEVVKTMLSDTVQSGMQMEGLPVLKSACEKMFARMTNGGSDGVTTRAVLRMGDKEIEVKPLTAADAKLATDRIGGLNRALIIDNAISAVLMEELPAFFSGQKTAHEVAGLIQNRVTTILSE